MRPIGTNRPFANRMWLSWCCEERFSLTVADENEETRNYPRILAHSSLLARFVHDFSADDGDRRLELIDTIVRHGHVVAVQHDEIGELAGLDRAEHLLFADEERCVDRDHAERLPPIDGL